MKSENSASSKAFLPIAAAIFIFIFTAILCSQRGSLVPVSCSRIPDPADTVTEFFSAYEAGDYAACDRLITGYSSLGLASPSDPGISSILYKYVTDGFSFKVIGDPEVKGLDANVDVELTYLDLTSTTDVLNSTAADIAYEYAYSGIDISSEETAMNALMEALPAVTDNITDYYKTETVVISLSCDGKNWHIIPDDALIAILSGGLR